MYRANDQFNIEEFNLNSDYYIRFNLNSVSFTNIELRERFTILEKLNDNTLYVKHYLDGRNYEVNVADIFSYRGPIEDTNYSSRTAYNLELCEPQFKDNMKPNWYLWLSNKYGSENILHRGKSYWYNYMSVERQMFYNDMALNQDKEVIETIKDQMALEQRVEAIPAREGVGTEFDENYGFNLAKPNRFENWDAKYRSYYMSKEEFENRLQWASRVDLAMTSLSYRENPALLGKYNPEFYKHYNPEEKEQINAKNQLFYLKEIKRILEENGIFGLKEITINKFGKLFGIPNQASINEQIKEFGFEKGTYSLMF